jgi:hypothetical protein
MNEQNRFSPNFVDSSRDCGICREVILRGRIALQCGVLDIHGGQALQSSFGSRKAGLCITQR